MTQRKTEAEGLASPAAAGLPSRPPSDPRPFSNADFTLPERITAVWYKSAPFWTKVGLCRHLPDVATQELFELLTS
jgi:hypothetical protein